MSKAVDAAGKTSPEYLGMSDDDFIQINAPATETAETNDAGQGETPGSAVSGDTHAAESVDGGSVEDTTVEGNGQDTDDADATGTADDAADGASESGSSADDAADAATDAKPEDKSKAGDKTAKDEKAEASDDAAKDGVEDESKPVDYEAFFKQVMTPFKANGKEITLKTPEEAIRLMQMGAGFGRKIQDLQPHLKVIRMLEKNNLLDESRLSFLIDVNQNNPDAIKKIIKDSGIDPLDLNIEDNVSYQPKNHSVSDKEMVFQDALADIQGHANGQETLRTINQTWDPESKSALWDQPQLLSVIQTQRDNGLYDQITAEIDRQKLLGTIPHNTPFLQAYKTAGDHLQTTNGFRLPEGQAPQSPTQSGATSQKQVLATRTAAPKAQVANGDKAEAASPTKSAGSRKSGSTVNPLQMADDDFLKQFKDRL